jgi:hypothetical protein
MAQFYTSEAACGVGLLPFAIRRQSDEWLKGSAEAIEEDDSVLSLRNPGSMWERDLSQRGRVLSSETSAFDTSACANELSPSAKRLWFAGLLDALLTNLSATGVWIDPKHDDSAFERFAWIKDGAGNRVELWQPVAND